METCHGEGTTQKRTRFFIFILFSFFVCFHVHILLLVDHIYSLTWQMFSSMPKQQCHRHRSQKTVNIRADIKICRAKKWCIKWWFYWINFLLPIVGGPFKNNRSRIIPDLAFFDHLRLWSVLTLFLRLVVQFW